MGGWRGASSSGAIASRALQSLGRRVRAAELHRALDAWSAARTQAVVRARAAAVLRARAAAVAMRAWRQALMRRRVGRVRLSALARALAAASLRTHLHAWVRAAGRRSLRVARQRAAERIEALERRAAELRIEVEGERALAAAAAAKEKQTQAAAAAAAAELAVEQHSLQLELHGAAERVQLQVRPG